jgi:NADPH-dependent 2,4-dienoyl-CoA reductase/sulfur reductase-like enzyme
VTADGAGVAIVGAGVAGLAAAAALAPRVRVTVFDRLPAVGGVLGYEHPLVERLSRECESAAVVFKLATTAVRWRDGALLAAGPEGIAWHPATRLVNAGGARPGTAAELRLAGSRLAGVLPATVALHLLEARVVLGRHVVVLGSGWWADIVARHLREQGASITSVVAPAEARSVDGSGRVSSVTVTDGSLTEQIACDAVVLAGDLKPLRNVDGAIFPGDPAVEFIQPLGADIRAEEVAALAADAAGRLAHDPPGGTS